MSDQAEFKEKARRHIFDCGLKAFPVVLEMYIRAFHLDVPNFDYEATALEVFHIIRTSADADTAYIMVCHFLDTLEDR